MIQSENRMIRISILKKMAVGAAVIVTCCEGCASRNPGENNSETSASADSAENPAASISVEERPQLLDADVLDVEPDPIPSIPAYTVNPDFSDTINPELLTYYYFPDEAKQKLAQNYFVVVQPEYGGDEFFEEYEMNTYDYIPSFVTTDSLLHTFHLYYVYVQKGIEQDYLRNELISMAQNLYNESVSQLTVLSGSEFESAARRNKDYFAVELILLGQNAETDDAVNTEVSSINEAVGIADSPLFGTQMDYSQFKPRSYYTSSEELSSYFKAVKWLGEANFTASDEDLDRSALLASLAIRDAAESEWKDIYSITAFFSGESDDHCYYEYLPLVNNAYGEGVTVDQIAGNEEAFASYHEKTQKLAPPKINSMVVLEGQNRDTATTGMRILGSRITLDGSILQQMIYRDLPENAEGEKRMLPDALDVPAALGSEEAENLVLTTTNASSWDYETQMDKVKEAVSAEGKAPFTASVSSAWLGTLQPLLSIHGEGWPVFMQSTAWTDKNLNTFLGSYTELKHDTALYAKQVMAEMGADGDIPDDRGYVEPEPSVYRKIGKLASAVETKLKEKNLISDEACQGLENFQQIADELASISVKELNNELLSDSEFDFIRSYGGQLDHLWHVASGLETTSLADASENPSALVTDIATDGDSGTCLELANGRISDIFVIVYFDGQARIARGAVYSFYQFTQPLSDRLTDEEWKGMVQSNNVPSFPSWTSSFRAQ